MIQTDDQVLLAHRCIGNLSRVLLKARRVHSRHDNVRLSEPILLEIPAREQEILDTFAGTWSNWYQASDSPSQALEFRKER
jgi:hypothetical protein